MKVTADNPFLSKYNDKTKVVQRGTKVLIQNIPLSVPNININDMVVHFVVKMKSDIGFEYELDENRQMTNIKNGTRSVFLDTEELEAAPIPRFSYCGNWRCRIQYRGQPVEKKRCYKCFGEGHLSRECREERGCAVCHVNGHLEGSS